MLNKYLILNRPIDEEDSNRFYLHELKKYVEARKDDFDANVPDRIR